MARPLTYSRTQIALHWTIVLLVLFQLFLHEGMEAAFHERARGIEVAPINPHVIAGTLVLVLVLWRLYLRLTRGTPPPPDNEHPLLSLAASIVHWAFYAALIIMPVSGIALWFFDIEPAGYTHNLVRYVLLLLIAIHFVAALMHHFWFRTNVLMRMLGRA